MKASGNRSFFQWIQAHLGFKTGAFCPMASHIPAVLFLVMEQFQPDRLPMSGFMPVNDPEFPDPPVHQLLKREQIADQVAIDGIVQMSIYIQMAVLDGKNLFAAGLPCNAEPG